MSSKVGQMQGSTGSGAVGTLDGALQVEFCGTPCDTHPALRQGEPNTNNQP